MTATRFFSDNAAIVHPRVMEAIAAANHVDAPYDGDTLSAKLDDAFSDLFETRCTALWIATGTAAICPMQPYRMGTVASRKCSSMVAPYTRNAVIPCWPL